MIYIIKKYFLLCGIICLFSSCDDKQLTEKKIFDTSIKIEATDITLLYHEGSILQYIIQAKKLIEYTNGNRKYPQGIQLKAYLDGKIFSTLQSNEAMEYKEKKILIASGNVCIENKNENQKLYTTAITLDQKKEQIYTEKYVKIINNEEVLTGKGLIADKDFTHYTILKPTGTLDIEE